jgi:ABC-2 type transport system ATP-binding protein
VLSGRPSAVSREAWIRLSGVQLARGGRPVLRDVSAELTGQAIGLVGANGAGKSTLIGALLGVLRPQAGSVHVLGMDLSTQAMEVRARCGVMAEQAGVFPGSTGIDAVAFAGTLSGLHRRTALRRAHRALDALAVGEERYRETSGYSTGMLQRCKLAMSLVHDPEILILDEPTVGLDPPGRVQLLRLIRDLRDEGRRILLSTHIMADAEYVCDSILLIEEGTIAYSGPVHRLVGEDFGFLRATGDGLDAELAAELEQGGYRIVERRADHLLFEPTGDPELHRFWRAAAERGAEVRSLGRESRSLEDAVVQSMEIPHAG